MRVPSTRSETTSNPSFFFITLEITARTECRCQPVCLQSSSRLTPPTRYSSTVIDVILLLFLASDCPAAPCFVVLLRLGLRASARFGFTSCFFDTRAATFFVFVTPSLHTNMAASAPPEQDTRFLWPPNRANSEQFCGKERRTIGIRLRSAGGARSMCAERLTDLAALVKVVSPGANRSRRRAPNPDRGVLLQRLRQPSKLPRNGLLRRPSSSFEKLQPISAHPR
jgi:hypothetical protein